MCDEAPVSEFQSVDALLESHLECSEEESTLALGPSQAWHEQVLK
jgi:hypothetical protein